MFEKVNKYHPDKLADRIAGAIVDLAYSKAESPKIAVEVLLGHGKAVIIAETSAMLETQAVNAIVERIAGHQDVEFIQVPQDAHLSENQRECIRCGDNGVFKAQWNPQYASATEIARMIGTQFPCDGKYLFDFTHGTATVCQSNAARNEIIDFMSQFGFTALTVNPLGEWTGGPNTDTGCTNRKLGSDQPFCNPNGLHGKDLSKADVSVSIYLNLLSREMAGAFVQAHCSIGDTEVSVEADGANPIKAAYEEIVATARSYIESIGGFEKFAEYGMI